MNDFNQDYNQFESNPNTVSYGGLTVKTLLGVIIAFAVAIPNLMQGDLFLSFLYNMSGFSFLFMSLGVTIVLGIIWATLYRTLMNDHGPVFNLITYVVTSAFAGLFLGNALIFAVAIIGSYAPELDLEMVASALKITTGATFIAVIGGVIAMPRLKMDGQAIKFFRNVSILLITLTFVSGIMWIIGFIFNIFGISFILDLYYQLVYGLGPVSIFFSVLAILAAEFLFLISLARSKYAVGREPKHMEYFYSIILVNAIIRIYVEIFKLVLKLLANSNRD